MRRHLASDPLLAIEIQERMLDRITVGGDLTWNGSSCWEWTRGKTESGYAMVGYLGKTQMAHRLSYRMFRGEIADGLVIDHLCENRSCINPDHLEPVTSYANTMRSKAPTAIHAQQTHCKRGHEFTAENTYVATSGRRVCRICNAAHRRARRIGLSVDDVVAGHLRQRQPKSGSAIRYSTPPQIVRPLLSATKRRDGCSPPDGGTRI